MKRLLLIDGMAVVYRAYYALNRVPRINSKGLNTSAILGFTNTILDLKQKLRPSHIGVAFDLHEPTFRHIEYPEYKAQRDPTPEVILDSIPYVKSIVEGLNIPVITMPGFEADDLIGTLAHAAEQAGFDEVLMATPDKDFAQLVTPIIKVYRFGHMKNPDVIMGIEEVIEKFHVKECRQVIDLLGLWGDAVDNIPGIPGVGEKSAQKLIAQFGSIEAMVERSSEISNNHLRELVQQHADKALLSKHLATIVQDAPIPFDEELLRTKDPIADKLMPIFAELEFRQLSRKVFPGVPDPALSSSADKAARPTKSAKTAKAEGQLDLFAQPDLFSQASEPEQKPVIVAPTAPFEVVADHAIRMEDTIVCYNYKSLIGIIDVPQQQVFDILLVHYLVDPEARHSLDFIALQQLGVDMTSAGQEPEIMAALYPVLKEKLEAAHLEKIYSEIELPLAEVLRSMEQEGVRIDVGALKAYSQKLTEERDSLEQQIFLLAGTTFNISSPKQLGEVLYEQLKITDKPPKTATKQYSTAEDVLLKLQGAHPIVPLILEYRSLSKLIGTYLDSFPNLINSQTGRLHTIYNQAVTATGRLSSSNPNLQNIPIRTERGRYIRQAFVARNEDYQILAADYSQIELRLIADFSGDQNMREAFANGYDIHAATAAKIYGCSIDQVTKDQRRNAKSVNFGIVYGISAFGLSEQLGCSRKEAQQLIDDYGVQFPAIKQYIEQQKDFARQHGYAQTVLGRRRYLPDVNSRNGSLRNFAERNAVNMPIQGTSADMIKIAMVDIYNRLKGMKSCMILQVHDEVVIDAYKPELQEVKEIVESCMLSAAKRLCNVPIEVGIDVGDNWLEAH